MEEKRSVRFSEGNSGRRFGADLDRRRFGDYGADEGPGFGGGDIGGFDWVGEFCVEERWL